MQALTLEELTRRLHRLEALEAIRQLKYRYFASCDSKQPEAVRQCFCDGPVDIQFGRIGDFDTADALVAVFAQLGCEPHIIEMHHAQNPRIELLSATEAVGDWALYYYMIDTRLNTTTQLGGSYHDRYRLQGSEWRIAASRFEVSSTQLLGMGEAGVNCLFAGATAPADIDDPSRQAAD